MNCPHAEISPVTLPITGEIVAQMCTSCFESLPPSYGCPDCEWLEIATLGEGTYPVLGTPCAAHFIPF